MIFGFGDLRVWWPQEREEEMEEEREEEREEE